MQNNVTVVLDVEGIRQEVAAAAERSVLHEIARQIHAELTTKNAFFTDRTGAMRRSFKLSRMRYGTGYNPRYALRLAKLVRIFPGLLVVRYLLPRSVGVSWT